MPLPSDTSPITAAPAPSPSKTQVLRSFQSIIFDNLSTPTMSMRLQLPVSKNCLSVNMAYMNPAQAAPTSIAAALLAPSLSSMIQATDGNGVSGVTVATIIMSNSDASTP